MSVKTTTKLVVLLLILAPWLVMLFTTIITKQFVYNALGMLWLAGVAIMWFIDKHVQSEK